MTEHDVYEATRDAFKEEIPYLEAHRIYNAISLGVQRAMWQLMSNATMMPCADFYDSVKAGVKEAMEKSLGGRNPDGA